MLLCSVLTVSILYLPVCQRTLFDHNEFGTVPHKALNNLCIVKLSFQSQAKSRQYERIIKQLIHKRSLLGCFFVRVLIECISHYNRHGFKGQGKLNDLLTFWLSCNVILPQWWIITWFYSCLKASNQYYACGANFVEYLGSNHKQETLSQTSNLRRHLVLVNKVQ